MKLLDKLKINHKTPLRGLDLLKYIGPGLLVTVGFIDPGNWATNLAAGSEFGYALLWVVTFSSIMLIIIQHNVAHLGIVTGLCLSEATNKYMPRMLSRPILGSAMLGQYIHLSGGNPGWSHCPSYAVRYADQDRGSHHYDCLSDHAAQQHL